LLSSPKPAAWIESAAVRPNVGLPQICSVSSLCSGPLIVSAVMKLIAPPQSLPRPGLSV